MQMKRVSPADQALLTAGRIAVGRAMWWVLRANALPWTAREAGTSSFKLTDRELSDDPTEPLDAVARQAMIEVLQQASRTPGDPLSRGFLMVEEESGLVQFQNSSGTCDESLVVFIDPVDYTMAANRGLDGSVLISFYDRNSGFRAAVVGDIFRRRLFWRLRGSNSECITVIFTEDPTHPYVTLNAPLLPHPGLPVDLSPSTQQTLKGSCINVFVGRPERLAGAAAHGNLWMEKTDVKHIFSVGGSLGPLRVAEGIFDASLEVVKGYRPWDFAPGAFIAQGAGARVVDLMGHELGFESTIPTIENFIRSRSSESALAGCRTKFIVAGTTELALDIVAALGNEATGSGESRGRSDRVERAGA